MPAREKVMSDCNFQRLLVAYHDGEHDDCTQLRVEKHLADCPACAAELSELRELSARIEAATGDCVDREALARMHGAVDRVAATDAARLPLLRTAGLLGALAASVLIIAGVWLLDTRRDRAGPADLAAAGRAGDTVAIMPDWERVAMTLRAEPRPGIGADSPLSPHYAATIRWMLDGLLPAGGRTEGKPWAEPKSF